VVEPDPVRIVEDPDAAERLRQPGGIVERQRADLEVAAEGIGLPGRVRERADPDARVEQSPGHEPAREPEGPGDGVELRTRVRRRGIR
jgi:hypothetical protein